MQRHRFYAPPGTEAEGSIRLDATESHHLCRVLRLSAGDQVFAFDGEGREWECEVVESHQRSSRLTVRRELDEVVESPLNLTLAQALTRSDRFDLVIQKATELGVNRITPVITGHSEIRRTAEVSTSRYERWQRISLEALKQCRRRRIVTIDSPVLFPALCQNLTNTPALILSEYGGQTFPQLSGNQRQLTLVVGPEGGWSKEEVALANASGLIAIYLGPRILRTETAAIAALTLAQFQSGDLSGA